MKNDHGKAPLSKKVGDKIERVGQKISNSGASKLGNFVSRMGDKLEHANDPKADEDTDIVRKNK